MEIEKHIERFIRRHHVLTLATCAGRNPWCANMFYAYVPGSQWFVFTSDEATRHASDAADNPQVALSVVLESRIVGRVQGLQVQGRMRRARGEEFETAHGAYLRRFPYAAAASLTLWIVEPEFVKLTDNTLGFGRKLTAGEPR